VDLLYLSHCLPYPPNKGERIRAFHEVKHLMTRHRVHVVCFTRGEDERQAVPEFRTHCSSLYTEPLPRLAKLASSLFHFARGQSLVAAFYESPSMRDHLSRLRVDGAVIYTAAMASSIPHGMPMLIDHVDVDSEKWFQYAQRRWPSFVFGMEGRRFRLHERQYSELAEANCLSTTNEEAVFAKAHPGIPTFCVENGVDFDFFDPVRSPDLPELGDRDYLAFVGVMNYYPNSSGVCSFASDVLPLLRQANPNLELFIVGRDPSSAVQRLKSVPGVTVTGKVPDVRPYLNSARAVVTPLPIARGIQNKVLESLAMGKQVFASPEVCDTFGDQLPLGVTRCNTAVDYSREITLRKPAISRSEIRVATQKRFRWSTQMEILCARVDRLFEGAISESPCMVENA
jgi:polysaccharide biosynthesis protein PslH